MYRLVRVWESSNMLLQVGATKNVAWRFHGDNIRCNAVLPGGKPHRLVHQ